MKSLTLKEARELVESRLAGWYAVNANPPILHNASYVVSLLDGRHFLVSGTDLSIKPAGLTIINGIIKQANAVTFDGDSDIGKLLIQDIESAKQKHSVETSFAALCTGIESTAYTGRRRGP